MGAPLDHRTGLPSREYCRSDQRCLSCPLLVRNLATKRAALRYRVLRPRGLRPTMAARRCSATAWRTRARVTKRRLLRHGHRDHLFARRACFRPRHTVHWLHAAAPPLPRCRLLDRDLGGTSPRSELDGRPQSAHKPRPHRGNHRCVAVPRRAPRQEVRIPAQPARSTVRPCRRNDALVPHGIRQHALPNRAC